MKRIVMIGVAASATVAGAAEVAIVSYDAGKLGLTVTGSGTVTVVAQADFKYYSDALASEALARATSAPLKVAAAAAGTPVTVNFVPPGGQVLEIEIVIFVNGEEKTRQTFYY